MSAEVFEKYSSVLAWRVALLAALARNKDVLELRRIEGERVKAERWNGQLPQNVYAGAPIPYFNVGHP